ncbi:MAG: two pore domain potassium channel family protein [Saccharothrix sp.]|nr:two pore domain potassium channel family protein [Saccharothrix sp.]
MTGAVVAGLAVVALVLLWQLRAISRSRHPVRRGVHTLVVVATLFVLVFANAYRLLSTMDSHAFTEPLDLIDASYFAVTVFATVGFGDIAPVTPAARLAVTAQMCGDVVLVGGVARVVVEAVRARRRRIGDQGD